MQWTSLLMIFRTITFLCASPWVTPGVHRSHLSFYPFHLAAFKKLPFMSLVSTMRMMGRFTSSIRLEDVNALNISNKIIKIWCMLRNNSSEIVFFSVYGLIKRSQTTHNFFSFFELFNNNKKKTSESCINLTKLLKTKIKIQIMH